MYEDQPCPMPTGRCADLNYRLASDPSLHGAVEPLLTIAVKPRWRAVLRALAQRLGAAGIAFGR